MTQVLISQVSKIKKLKAALLSTYNQYCSIVHLHHSLVFFVVENLRSKCCLELSLPVSRGLALPQISFVKDNSVRGKYLMLVVNLDHLQDPACYPLFLLESPEALVLVPLCPLGGPHGDAAILPRGHQDRVVLKEFQHRDRVLGGDMDVVKLGGLKVPDHHQALLVACRDEALLLADGQTNNHVVDG